jgi:hypothetical protein
MFVAMSMKTVVRGVFRHAAAAVVDSIPYWTTVLLFCADNYLLDVQ